MAQEGEIVPNGEGLPLTRAERLTEQFYSWEKRGRGWRVWPYAVELEPPFRPFFYHYVPRRPAFDDGRKPTFFSALADKILGKTTQPVVNSDYSVCEEDFREPDAVT